MSDEFGLTNVGSDGVQEIPVESKEPTLAKEVDKELQEMPLEQLKEQFDETQAIVVPAKKKRGRPAKKVDEVEEDTLLREYYCATCRERVLEKNTMRIGAGEGRYAIFCPYCQKSLGFFDEAMVKKIENLHRHPTSK